MKIKIKENEKPSLPICQMSCDDGLRKRLNKYDLTKFMNSHETNLLIGRPGSGKTSLLYSLFKGTKKDPMFRDVFHNIYLFQPSHSRGSMKDDIFSELPQDQLFEELNYDDLKDVMETIKTEPSHYNHCIIFDDMGAYLREASVLQLMRELIFNRRHLHCSIFFLVQNWKSVHPDIRKLFSNIFLFRVSKKEMDEIASEVVESKQKYMNDISKLVYNKPYKYLFINVNTQRLFDGFDEIIIDDE